MEEEFEDDEDWKLEEMRLKEEEEENKLRRLRIDMGEI